MTKTYKALKKSFPVNIFVALVLGILVGYFASTYVISNVGGKATGEQVCGNNIREGTEKCDGGFGSCTAMLNDYVYKGTGPCSSDCSGFSDNTPQCTKFCGNGKLDEGEECDPGKEIGLTCPDVNTAFVGGELACTDGFTCGSVGLDGKPTCGGCKLAVNLCEKSTKCGDGIKGGDEQCDGNDFGTATCEKLGYPGGQLTCNPDCTRDESSCTATCTDDDASAEDPTKSQGTVCINGQNCVTDGCVSNQILNEFFCMSPTSTSVASTSHGCTCVDGACLD